MIISHKYKFIFIKTRKTAGTSIEVYLSQFLAPEDVLTPIHPPVQPHEARNYQGTFDPFPDFLNPAIKLAEKLRTLRDFLVFRKFYNHIPAYKVRNRVSDDIWRNYYKFCVDRNPWDKTLSHYFMIKDKLGEKFTLDEYLRGESFCINYPLYTNETSKDIIVDQVLRYEELSKELKSVFQRFNLPFDGNLHVRAKSEYRGDKRPYKEVLTDSQRDLIAERFEREIHFHGYKF